MTPSDTAHPEGEMKALGDLVDAVEAFIAGYRAQYSSGKKTIRPNAPMRSAVAALNDAYMAVPPLNTRSTPPSRPQGEEGLGRQFKKAGVLLSYDGVHDTGYRFVRVDDDVRPNWLRGARSQDLYEIDEGSAAISNQGKPSS